MEYGTMFSSMVENTFLLHREMWINVLQEKKPFRFAVLVIYIHIRMMVHVLPCTLN